MESDARYFARRAAQEASLAARALSEERRAWHRQLADQFASRARAEHCALSLTG